MKKLFTILIAAGIVCSLFAGCGGGSESSSGSGDAGASGTVIIKAGHGATETTGMHIGWATFKELVESRSGGEIYVEIYPNQQLGGDRELIEATQIGNITACSPSSTVLSPFCSEFYVLDIPFLFSDRESTYAILDGTPGQTLNTTLESVGLKGLGHMENGFRNFSNSKVPVHLPQDVQGLKIRTMENKIHMSFWSMAGASPTPMAFGELFTALQQGTVDGQENPFELIYNNKFYEVQEYITETRHLYTPYTVVFNLDFYNSLSDEHRQIVDDAMSEAIQAARAAATANDEECKANIIAAGTEVISLTPEETAAWREVMSPILDEIRDEAGTDIVDLFTSAASY